jgi:phage terminase large subunit-like protein
MIRSEAYKRPENFYVTNPNMGASVDEPTLLDEFERSARRARNH